MFSDAPQFGTLSISRQADGKPVVLQRSRDELVFLAFETRIRRLVELHVLNGGAELSETAKESALTRARQACGLRMPSLTRVLDIGEDNNLIFYTSNLCDGEFIQDYIRRRGPLSAPTTFALVFQLLEDLLQLRQRQPRLLNCLTLDPVLVGTVEDTFLQLRVVDFGLSRAESDDSGDHSHLVAEVCQMLFLMLTGKEYAGDNPDRFPVLTQLPSSLRTSLRACLNGQETAPRSLERLRDDVREAFSILGGGAQSKNLRKHLVVIGPLQPESQLQPLLLENVSVQTIFGAQFRVEESEQSRRYPFSIPAVNSKSEQPVTVHMLPPSRIVDRTKYEAVPLQMWRFNPERHPNILRSLSVWESPDWTFLTEEREPGFTLSRLMAERVALTPSELLVLMKQVRAGLEQSQECGVPRIDLHPSNILLRVGKNGPTMARESERLMQRRLDAWPPFSVKLRPHMTMRSLYEPQLIDFDPPQERAEDHVADRDFRHRSFIFLTAYLLAGERQTGGSLQFPETVPEATAVFVREACDLALQSGLAPAPADFLAKFEATLSPGNGHGDLASRLRGGEVALEEMESAGAISDFDEDQSVDDEDSAAPFGSKQEAFRPYASKGDGLPWIVWAAAAVILLGLTAWWLLDRPVEVDLSGANVAPKVENAPTAAPTPPANAEEKSKPSENANVVAEKASASSAPAAKTQDPPTPLPAAEKQPVIIRKALLPSQEELDKMRQGQVKDETIGRKPPEGRETTTPVADTRP